MISHWLLHDAIKSELDHNAVRVYELCKTLPQVKTSNLFRKPYWIFRDARQEQTNERFRQADAVWYFDGPKNDLYYIVHEVKTGEYSVAEIFKKYHRGMALQIWVWGWSSINRTKVVEKKAQVKILDIESILPILTPHLYEVYRGVTA